MKLKIFKLKLAKLQKCQWFVGLRLDQSVQLALNGFCYNWLTEHDWLDFGFGS